MPSTPVKLDRSLTGSKDVKLFLRQGYQVGDVTSRTQELLPIERGSHFPPKFLWRERFLDKAIRFYSQRAHVSLSKSAGHQDPQIGMNSATALHKFIYGHRKTDIIRDEKRRLPFFRSQRREGFSAIIEGSYNVTRRLEQARVQLCEARHVVHCIN